MPSWSQMGERIVPPRWGVDGADRTTRPPIRARRTETVLFRNTIVSLGVGRSVNLDPATVHARRWWALAVMCLSLMVIGIDNTVLNVAIPSLIRDLHADARARSSGSSTATRSCSPACSSRAAASVTGSGARARSPSASRSSRSAPSRPRCADSANTLIFTACLHGHRRRADHARDALAAHQRLPRPEGARPRDRRVGRGRRRQRAASVRSSVASCCSTSRGAPSSSSTSPSASPRIVAGHFVLPDLARHRPRHASTRVGAVLSIGGLVALLWAFIEAPAKGWTSPTVIGGLRQPASCVLFSFVVWELHIEAPDARRALLQEPRASPARARRSRSSSSRCSAPVFLFTQYLQTVLGYSTLEAGIRMLPHGRAPADRRAAVAAPRRAVRHQARGRHRAPAHGRAVSRGSRSSRSRTAIRMLLTGLIIVAVGMGMVMAPATESIMGSLPKTKAGVGSAMNDTTRQMGGALGVAVIGSLFASLYRPGIEREFRAAGLPSDCDRVGQGLAQQRARRRQHAARLTRRTHERHRQARVRQRARRFAPRRVRRAARRGDHRVRVPPRPGAACRRGAPEPLEGLASLTFAEAEGILVSADAGRPAGVEIAAERRTG